ncbi:MAG: hypothetical protein JRC77_02125 [Deltaproteobacteria bacterium]|nr:hypothetical protein [Deltaproteobacteria bacterium]
MRDSEKILNPALYGEEAAQEAVRRLDAAPIKVDLGMGNFLIIDREEKVVIQGPEDALLSGEIRAILDAGTAEGNSTNFDTPHHFSWSSLSDPRYILVVSTPQEGFSFPMQTNGWFQTFVVLIAMLLGVAASQYLCSDIDWSVKKLRLHMEEVANGNLRVAAFESEDDLGYLGRNFETMTAGLREIITKVAHTADRVEQGSNAIVNSSGQVSLASISQTGDIREVTHSMRAIDDLVKSIANYAVDLSSSVDASSSSIDELSQTSGGLTEAGASLAGNVDQIANAYARMFETIESVNACTFRFSHAATETSSGMHQMSSALQEVNRNASETSRLSEAVIDSAERGQTKVQETISGIGSIRENTQVVEEMINDFSDKAKQIGGIISVIDDVAEETNLLALNAAVIAPQAGEQGRAFSVVADEINELADRVLTSTKEISNLIKSVQQSASDAVVAIERGSESVESGLSLSQEAGTALEDITSSARESGTRMHEVVAAVGEQSRAAEHLARMMSEVIEAIQQIEVVSKDQSQSTEAVIESNKAMSAVAEQIQRSNQEQGRSTDAIKGHVNQVRQVTTGISSSLVEEAKKVALVGQLLEAVNASAITNEQSTASMTQAAEILLNEAAELREGIKRFKI